MILGNYQGLPASMILPGPARHNDSTYRPILALRLTLTLTLTVCVGLGL